MKTVIIIPARYKSSRFPGKPLAKLLGKSLIIWVAELCAKALEKEDVFVATDDQRIADAVTGGGFNVIMTSQRALTGTDRLWEAAQQIKADIYVNVQGDEPLVDPLDIKKIIKIKKRFPDEVINGMALIGPEEDPRNVNIPKTVVAENMRLVYMSRLPVPGSKNKGGPEPFFKQICIYAFSRDELKAFAEFGRKGRLENIEDIEILRFFELGIPVRMVMVGNNSCAVDVPEDIRRVEKILKSKKNGYKASRL